ncbi:glycoside hydrolase superfamily [Mycotypha africana]|uniref:glycoside hydrolase superfamily n=1 Tax=Mycotypha africana TaxID=64632 RepID=UPI002300A8F7|nr:glycoside hydrolase superfamily [Mycotypha africana]KAI8977320.1 glycoside hydrolase superfamily [Mycotypha africana]
MEEATSRLAAIDSTNDLLLNNDDAVFTASAQELRPSNIQIQNSGTHFIDQHGRVLTLRGINVSGSSKLPSHPLSSRATHLYDPSTFWDHRHVRFNERPFPSLEETHDHWKRLQLWGFNTIRLLVTWESINHEGPGIYDDEYIDYLRQIIGIMPEYGLRCIIDPHQDTWSRYSGGSGAPGWTFEVAGMNIENFKETGAAYVHNTNAVPGDPLPMVWPTNYTKLASCTMFTLFFGGDTFAPHRKYDNDKSIQQFLNDHFIQAYQHLATRLVDLPAILGFEFMNEPHPGYIGLKKLDSFDPVTNLIFGDSPTPLQCFALGDRITQTVDVYKKSWPFPTRKSHSRKMNTQQVSAWLDAEKGCIWKEHGVWKLIEGGQPHQQQPVLLDTQYFAKHPLTGEKISFYNDFYLPIVKRYVNMIKSVNKNWYCMVEPLANERPPVYKDAENVVFSPHWYDLNSVFYKKFNGLVTHDVQCLQRGGNVFQATYFGLKGAKKNYRGQIRNIKADGIQNMGQVPCILGETGIPMDLNNGAAFTEKPNFVHHEQFMDAVLYAMETNLMNYILWNYDLCNDHEHGDHWNGENFSVYSTYKLPKKTPEDNDKYKYYGGRVLKAILRPYAVKTAGIPISSEFNMDKLSYTFSFKPFTSSNSESHSFITEFFVPYFHFGGQSLTIKISRGEFDYQEENQTLYHTYEPTASESSITISLEVRQEIKRGLSSRTICT